MGQLGKKAFISYRGSSYAAASALREQILSQRLWDSVVLVEPQALSSADEILLPFEYFELMEFIYDQLYNCDGFVILDTGNFWESYWTNEEVRQYRRFSDTRACYVARLDGAGRPQLVERGVFEPLSDNAKRLLARISVGTNRRIQASSRGATFWGRYARSCFVIPCGEPQSAGRAVRLFLASQKLVEAATRGEQTIRCPYCGRPVQVAQGPQRGTFYRRPVLLKSHNRNLPHPDADLLMALLVQDERPAGVELVHLPGETFDTDAMKVLKGYGWLAGAAGLAAGAAWLWEQLTKDQERRE